MPYEEQKRKLVAAGLSPAEYEKAIRELYRKYNI